MTIRRSTPKSAKHILLTIVYVAARLGMKYWKARDVMLSGACGPVTFEGRTVFVTEAGVRTYLRKVAAEVVAKKKASRKSASNKKPVPVPVSTDPLVK